MKCVVAIVLLMIVLYHSAQAQQIPVTPDTLQQYFEFEHPSPLSCLETLFPPIMIQHGIELQEFIRSKTFRSIRKQEGDLRAVDALYVRAMQLTNNNTGISLFLALAAVLEHRIISLKVPVFNLAFPLTNESEEDFRRRVNNLPKVLYSDSPYDTQGDKDKLQHFFGSAFLTFVFESSGSADRVGNFIEEGEDAMIVEGEADPRDVRANRQGQNFGTALLDDNQRLPSEFFKNPKKHLSMELEYSCRGVW